jgi:hypothetical protein
MVSLPEIRIEGEVMQPFFDAATGQLVNPGSPVFFVVVFFVVVAGLVIWKKLNPDSFKANLAKLKAEYDETVERARTSAPEFKAELLAKASELKAKIDAALK